MPKTSKRFKEAFGKIDREKTYSIDEAVKLIKETSSAKFDESVDVAVRLGIDTRKNDQQVRGAVVLPNGTGKTQKVLVFARGENARKAEEAGADHVGDQDMVNQIKQGWMDFDVVIATPDMMPQVGQLGPVLGPKGLMPNPKTGTVTDDVATAVQEAKAGKIEYRAHRDGNVHAPIGKVSFDEKALAENFDTVVDALIKAKPAAAKGKYIHNISVSSTMGPGIKVEIPTP